MTSLQVHPAVEPGRAGLADRAAVAACSTARSSAYASVEAFRKLDPRVQVKNPVMFVVLIGTIVTLIESIAHPEHLRLVRHRLAGADRAVRQLRRGRGRGARQGPGGHAAQDADRHRGPPTRRRRVRGAGRRRRAGQGRPGGLRGGRPDPVRRRDHRRARVGRRVGDHRRVGAGDPRVGRRPFGGHRRDQGAVGPDRRADHRRARPHLPGPDDRPGRGGQPAEDAERDRADDPAGRPDRSSSCRSWSPCSPTAPSRAARSRWSC